MDPATVATAIMSAIATTAADSLKEVGKKAVLDSYEALKKAIKTKFGRDNKVSKAIAELEDNPESKGRQMVLAETLEEETADQDPALIHIVKQLIQALAETTAGRQTLQKYNIDAKEAQIGGIGDNWQVKTIIFNPPPETKSDRSLPAGWESFYLRRLIEQCDNLELTTLEETCPREGWAGQGSAIRLSDVFTTLYLKEIARSEDQTIAEALARFHGDSKNLKRTEKGRLPIQAIEAAGAVPRLVILGRPGGGKSALVNHLATQMAHLCMGVAIPPDRLPGWPLDEKLLPVRIVLRRFAAWISPDCKKGTGGLVWKYLAQQLDEWGCAEYYVHLKNTLDESGGVIFFDGLDEVREQDEQRTRSLIVQAIEAFAAPLKRCRVIITCREYAYKKDDAWHLPEGVFPVVELNLFRLPQIKHFSQAWYRILGKWREWHIDKCLAEAADLCQAIEAWPHLKELGQYPLLLTLMAQVHGRDGSLPRDRADLYDRAVQLLLVHWDNRLVRDQDGTRKIEQGLIARLGIRTDTLRAALERIALAAHERQEAVSVSERTTGCADITREDLRDALVESLFIGLDRAEEVIAYIQHRAGLLQAEGNRIFRFPHRTFQEYLAAVCIMKRGDFEDYLKERVMRDMAWWREVFLLAAGSSRSTPRNVYQLVDALLPHDPKDCPLTPAIAAYAGLSAQAMAETEFLFHVRSEQTAPGRYTKIHKRVQTWLSAALTTDEILSPRERVAAGNALNWVGDPRFDPDRWYLPLDENDGFVSIPAGAFWMGSDTKKDKDAYKSEMPRHQVRVSPYAINKYPVTVAQYECFIQETGYPLVEHWKHYNMYGNHPVVMVSWQDAKAYCRWLAAKIGKPIMLPSEAQWEMAARGTDGRIYPWGDDSPKSNRSNLDQTGIKETSPVGAFPMGKSYYGVLDMAGNTFEWVEDDWHESYEGKGDPYDGRAWVDNPRGPNRVFRGGCWNYSTWYCRSACRGRNVPGDRINFLGFRLALLSGQPE